MQQNSLTGDGDIMASQAEEVESPDQKREGGERRHRQSLSVPLQPTSMMAILQQNIASDAAESMALMYDGDSNNIASSQMNMFTVKKGVLWQQQNHNKFRQKLFSRWKKRYFILTTDYLVCFKRSTSKVGRS